MCVTDLPLLQTINVDLGQELGMCSFVIESLFKFAIKRIQEGHQLNRLLLRNWHSVNGSKDQCDRVAVTASSVIVWIGQALVERIRGVDTDGTMLLAYFEKLLVVKRAASSKIEETSNLDNEVTLVPSVILVIQSVPTAVDLTTIATETDCFGSFYNFFIESSSAMQKSVGFRLGIANVVIAPNPAKSSVPSIRVDDRDNNSLRQERKRTIH
jgi:hypothetical protein